MTSIYKSETQRNTPKANVKSDRELFRRLLTTKESGRVADMEKMLHQEFCAVPLSLCTSDGKLRKAEKSQLMNILSKDASQPDLPISDIVKTCTIIDGMAVVQSIGKPTAAVTFGDLADVFVNCVKSHGRNSDRVDILFDRYEENSIKEGTRERRRSGTKQIRRLIKGKDTKLPQNWKTFITLAENKVDLARFLSEKLIISSELGGKEIIVSGEFTEITKTISTSERDVSPLSANHEEADTRIVLHACDAADHGYERTIVVCRDTDVLVMLTVFSAKLSQEVWMKAGTSKSPRMIRVHDIAINNNTRKGLLAFHALTGSDTTSQLAGISKNAAWKVFVEDPERIHGLEQNVGLPLSPRLLSSVEAFICKLYDPTTTSVVIQEIRLSKFFQCKTNIDYLPPTKDALILHCHRAHYQSLIWNQCVENTQSIPSAFDCGWYMQDGILKPRLMTLNPLRANTIAIKTCGCSKDGPCCRTRSCTCTKNIMCCTGACKCNMACMNPYNNVLGV
ncbi:Uncharacterised protein g7165 [Pycnogonum litorale]